MNVSDHPPIFISVKEAARLIGLTTWSMYQLLDKQAVKSQYHGRRRLVRYDSLRDYADGLPEYPEAG